MTDTSTTADRGSSSHAVEPKARRGFFGRILLFVRQVLDELRKVVRPTRQELINYTVVVIVFIVFIMLYVVGLDQISQRLVHWIFG